MINSDIIVVGGGAAGLMAARELGRAGKQVTLLEARNRLGGRIHTLGDSGFTRPAEAGAEFIHGDLPLTLALLREAGIRWQETEGEIWRKKDGRLTRRHNFIEQGDLLAQRLGELKEDMSIARFLDRYFPAPGFNDLRNSIKGFAEGYDAADITKASASAMRDEWEGEDASQYRPEGGYGTMIRFLESECLKNGCLIRLSSVVQTVSWRKGTVDICTADGGAYRAKQAVIAIPLNVLKAKPPETGAIAFIPVPVEKLLACEKMDAGSVIKILLEFSTPLWNDEMVPAHTGADLKQAGWIFSGEPVPTWWTQLPERSAMLTGWIAGPRAEALSGRPGEEIRQLAIQSVAAILSLSPEKVTAGLKASKVFSWTSADPFSRGAYAYNTIDTVTARKIVMNPEESTLYFAGEAFSEGPSIGTVEAALVSGHGVAAQILSQQGVK